MLIRILTVLCVLTCVLTSSRALEGQEAKFPSKVIDGLNQVFEAFATQPHVVNAAALVDAKAGELSWSRASGLANPQVSEKMTVNHQLRTASITKTFTGVLVMQLIEEGHFDLDTPIHELLSGNSFPKEWVAADLHVLDGKSYGLEITVRHLLNHTSGLADYWFDKGAIGDWDGKSWVDTFESVAFGETPRTFDPPTRLWTPQGLLEFYFEIGLNQRAHFRPGEGFLYSDTNYLLLGMIIEKATGKSLASCYRARILDPLGITRTYKEYRERPTADGILAHHFWFLRGRNLDVVELQLASTGEWANGGQVTTLSDLRTFIRGLFAGKLFRGTATLELMKDAAKLDLDEPHAYFDNGEQNYNRYTCGLKRWDVNSVEVWGHTGFWGIGMFYVPSSDVCIVIANNQVTMDIESDMKHYVNTLIDSGLIVP